MKHLLKSLLAFSIVLGSLQSFAQNTVVTGTVVDASGIPYAGGTVQPVFQNVSGGATPTITATGGLLIVPNATQISNAGTFSLSIPANANITPSGSLWGFSICAQGTPTTLPDPMLTGSQCFFLPSVTISGSTQNITSLINAVGPLALVQSTIAFSVANGGTGLQQVATQSILTKGTGVAAGSTQVQTPSITIPGLSNTSACMASLAPGNGQTTLPASWQTGIQMTVVVSSNTATLQLINPTPSVIQPIGAQVNIKCIL